MSTIYKKLMRDSSSISAGMLYGVINSVMIIPVTISFCSIIYRDKEFEQYLPQLVKLVLFSSMIHQIAFTQFSSLPFAIGQVQDAGLIFLSSMAADIVRGCAQSEHIVPTAIVILPLCTFLLGCMLVVVAKLKLATVIQYLPMPVIGGYLAFIGFFCGQAGLSMMAGVQVVTIMDWGNFWSVRALILLTPGVVLGVTTYLLLCRVRSPYVLPCCMLGILSIFYGLLFVCGMTLDDARAYGWIAPLSVPGNNLGVQCSCSFTFNRAV
jgi:SulP family sulfate permease